ncbi:MAG: peroxidase family protein [Cyanobacteria bacterium P01_A01_bin.83]
MDTSTVNSDIDESGSTSFYSIDGTDNNSSDPDYGSTGSDLFNIAPLDYGDGISSPAGSDRPNAREISNTLAQQDQILTSDRGLTNFSWAFGQFVDHDIILTPEVEGSEVEIHVPTGDPFLDPEATGTVTIPLDTTAFTEGTGTSIDNPAQIPNNITAWVDGSNIYGSDQERNDYLRAGSGGLLKVSEGNLLPFGDESFDNANPSRQDPAELFAAGDARANENSVLVSIHTLFVREHNRLAQRLAIANPDWTDDQLYEQARQTNIAQYQAIVYNEYLPSILGDVAIPEYSGYDSSINPSIDRSFSSAAFRIGHTQLSSEIPRLDIDGREIAEGNLTLSEVFFRSTGVIQEAGIDPILRGLSSSLSQNVDLKLIDDVRNLLFTFGTHTTGRDLFAINLERGRINGVNDYNTVREAYGLARVDSFDDITSDVEIQAHLESLYGTVDNIDLYVGLLAEDHLPGVAVGETFQTIIAEQFIALRDGDHLYYENIFSAAEIAKIQRTTLSKIILRNTETVIIQDNAFSLLNEGTEFNDDLSGGLGNDSIYGFGGDDLIIGGVGDNYLVGGAGDDFLVDFGGRDLLEGGSGDDSYRLRLDSPGSEIIDTAGFDNLVIIIIDNEPNSDNVNSSSSSSTATSVGQTSTSEDSSFFSFPEIVIGQPSAGIIGLSKSGNDLIVDLNRDGIARLEDDLKITNFFNGTAAGSGFIEDINNASGDEILNYFGANTSNGDQASVVHRFFIPSVGSHFYTASEIEKQAVIDNLPNYVYEGASYQAASSSDTGSLTVAKPVYRFFNQNTGVHLYTISEVEKNYVQDNLSNYTFENVAYYAYDTPQENSIELYRFYQSEGDFHFYTPSVAERDYIAENLPQYQLEGDSGIAYYVEPFLNTWTNLSKQNSTA